MTTAVALPLVLIQRALALPTLREQALSDHKTGLLNSRGIDQRARSEFARARRLELAISVLLCDVDDLREINNRFGHLAIGAASLGAEETQIGEMIARADAAMYCEKRAGSRSFLTVG